MRNEKRTSMNTKHICRLRNSGRSERKPETKRNASVLTQRGLDVVVSGKVQRRQGEVREGKGGKGVARGGHSQNNPGAERGENTQEKRLIHEGLSRRGLSAPLNVEMKKFERRGTVYARRKNCIAEKPRSGTETRGNETR